MKPEALIEHQILYWLRVKKIFCWKQPNSGYFDAKRKVFRKQASPFALNGVSDILGVYQGRMLAIEVKAPKGIVSPQQKAFIDSVNENGGLAFVARSVDEVIQQLTKEVA